MKEEFSLTLQARAVFAATNLCFDLFATVVFVADACFRGAGRAALDLVGLINCFIGEMIKEFAGSPKC